MEITIRENVEAYLQELKQWLAETEDQGLEEMSAFFSARIGGYEDHMSLWKPAYQTFARLLPERCEDVLDLGCGTGLELDEIWKQRPNMAVTGVDLCQEMLSKLLQKHPDKNLTVACEDYFQYDMGERRWDAVISFESLHHFLPDTKKLLYQKIYRSLKDGGQFILGDYLACCQEEEELLRRVYLGKRKKFHIPEGQFVHFDIPLTVEQETKLLKEVGFASVSVADSMEGATLLVVKK